MKYDEQFARGTKLGYAALLKRVRTKLDSEELTEQEQGACLLTFTIEVAAFFMAACEFLAKGLGECGFTDTDTAMETITNRIFERKDAILGAVKKNLDA